MKQLSSQQWQRLNFVRQAVHNGSQPFWKNANNELPVLQCFTYFVPRLKVNLLVYFMKAYVQSVFFYYIVGVVRKEWFFLSYIYIYIWQKNYIYIYVYIYIIYIIYLFSYLFVYLLFVVQIYFVPDAFFLLISPRLPVIHTSMK